MFHWKDNTYFARFPNGSVRILKMTKPAEWPRVTETYPAHLVEFDVTIDASSWASIVASVSSLGEGNSRFYEALDFHNGRQTRIGPNGKVQDFVNGTWTTVQG